MSSETKQLPYISKIQTNQLQYLLVFVPLFLAYLGNIMGGIFTTFGIGFVLILTLLDFVLKKTTKPEIKDEKYFSNHILFGVAFFQFAVILSFLWGVSDYGNVFGQFYWYSILSSGFAVAIAAAAGAHELIHRRADFEKNIGSLQLALVFYGHHPVEHIQGHHRHVATDEDPSSPAIGTNFWSYLVKGYIQEIKDGYGYEAERLTKKDKKAFSLENQVVKWWSVNILFLLFTFIFGFDAVIGYILISLIFVVFHASVVYSQHYGLRREDGDRVGDPHSWQTNSIVTELFLLGFGNHSDHHTRVTKTYAEIVQKEDGPNMPFGYFASFVVAMFPPLWYSIVDKRIK
jgi:alkane 1-monooxygenase